MAVKKPIYRYQYKPTAATYFKPVLGEKEQLAKSVGTQVTNLEQRFRNVGIPTETGAKEADQRNLIEKALNLKADQNTLMDVLEILNRPTQVVTNVLSSLGDQDKRDVLTAAWEGLSGKEEIGARKALANLTGDKDLLKIKDDKDSKLDDIGQFVIDLGLEIVADPLTWITMGASAAKKAGLKAKQEGAEALFKQAGEISTDVVGIPTYSKRFGFEKAKLIEQKEDLIRQATDLLQPKPSFGQKVISKADATMREFSRKAIRSLPKDQAKAVLSGLRTIKNIGERIGGSFNALKDVGLKLRGKLDEVFNLSFAQLDILKSGVQNLDEQIEVIAKRYALTLDEAGKRSIRNAVEEIYEAGFVIGKDGTIRAGIGAAPRSKIRAADVASDIGNSARNYQYTTRRIAKENLEKVTEKVQDWVTKANQEVGESALTYTVKTGDNGFSYIGIRLNLDDADISAVTDLARKSELQEFVGKYQGYFRNLDTDDILDLGKFELTSDAKRILKDKDLGKVFRTYDDVIERSNKLMTTSTDGVQYSVSKLYDPKSIGDVRYVRRVRTPEYLLELSKKNQFEANPLLREVVSGTGKELNERLYRGTAGEYNDVLKLFFNAKDDRFAQDLYESAIDYIKVAESRFSMSEVTRLIFGLTPSKEITFKKLGTAGSGARITSEVAEGATEGVVRNLPSKLQKQALEQGYKIDDIVSATENVKFAGGADWAQDAQFLRPVDEVLNESAPFIKDKSGKTIGLNTNKSDVVTKEMAAEFKRRFPNQRILDDGFVQVDVVTNKAGKVKYNVTGGEFRSLFESLPEELKGSVLEYLQKSGMAGKKMAIHNSAYEMLKNAQNAYKVNINAGVKFYDKFLNLWKGVTLLSPSFHARNFWGNWTNMSLAGLNPAEIVKYTSEAWTEVAKRDEILKKIAAGTATVDDKLLLNASNTYISGLSSARRGVRDLENIAELRKHSPELKRKFASGFKGGYERLIQANFKFAERADEVQRLAMFKALKKKGLNNNQAIQRVREVLFDYGKLTKFEKDYMKRFLPFYTFMKENMQFQMKNMLQNSGRYKNMFRSYKYYLEEVADLDEKDIPKYMTGNMWLPLPFVVNKDDKEAISMLKLNLPASDFLEFVEDPLKKVSSSVAVPIKATWEFMTGVDTFTGAPIQRYPGERSLDRESDSLFKFLRNEKGEFDITKNPVIKKFTDDLGFRTLRRPLTAILDSIDTILGKQNVATGLFDVLEQTGITTTVKKEDINLTALYQQLEYLRNLKKLYEQNTGQTLPTQADYKFKPK